MKVNKVNYPPQWGKSFGAAVNLIAIFVALSVVLSSVSAVWSDDNLLKEGPISPRITSEGVEFAYVAPPKTKKVSLAGEFNSWDIQKNFLKYDGKRGIWAVVLPLKEGRYEYKFLIDGEWMAGPNLVLEITKGKDGRLAIKERPPAYAAPNTPYSGRINFSGKFISELGAERDSPSEDFYSRNSFSHLDLDWRISLSGGLNAFARMEYNSDTSSAYSGKILLRQANIVFKPSDLWEASAWHASKSVQFDNPMKVLDRPVSLRYQKVEFSDEVNPSKAFGLWEQMVLINTDFLNGNLKLFYSDLMPPATYFQGASEDNFGARYKHSFSALPLTLGFTARRVMGGWWPWADMGNNWFPDPTTIYGYSLDSSTRSLAALWYRGYLNKDFYSIDGRFEFLPGVDLWGESAIQSEELKTIVTSGNLPSGGKRWQIERGARNLFGIKYTDGSLASLEFSYGKFEGDFNPPLYSTASYPIDSLNMSFAARFNLSEKIGFAFSAATLKNSDMPVTVPLDLHPYSQNLICVGISPYETSGFGGTLVHAIKEETRFFSSVNFAAGIFSLGLKNKTSLLRTLQRYSSEGIVFACSSGAGDDEWLLSESLCETTLKVAKRTSLLGSLRYFYLEDRKGVSSESSSAYFVGLKYAFSSEAYLRLGFGLDPEGTDEDISADFDRRELFLYNKNSGNIMNDARALSEFNRISLKAFLKF